MGKCNGELQKGKMVALFNGGIVGVCERGPPILYILMKVDTV